MKPPDSVWERSLCPDNTAVPGITSCSIFGFPDNQTQLLAANEKTSQQDRKTIFWTRNAVHSAFMSIWIRIFMSHGHRDQDIVPAIPGDLHQISRNLVKDSLGGSTCLKDEDSSILHSAPTPDNVSKAIPVHLHSSRPLFRVKNNLSSRR